MTVKVDGAELTVQDVVRVARADTMADSRTQLSIRTARQRIAATRAYIDQNWMHDDAPLMYAFNTGVGLFKDQRVLIADMAAYQRKTVYAHATGVGEPFAEDVTRAMMLLRANAFASNYSGPRVELVERLIAFLNAGLHPVIPQKGSVGASGDLAPLGPHGRRRLRLRRSRDDLSGPPHARARGDRASGLRAGFRSRRQGCLRAHQRLDHLARARRARDQRCDARLLKHADIAMCLSLEAMRGELAAFDPRLHKARPHPGQASRRAQPSAHSRRHEALLAGCARRGLPRRAAPARHAGGAARAGRLFPALHAAGSRPGRRGGGICRAHHRNGDQFGHRQPADLR